MSDPLDIQARLDALGPAPAPAEPPDAFVAAVRRRRRTIIATRAAAAAGGLLLLALAAVPAFVGSAEPTSDLRSGILAERSPERVPGDPTVLPTIALLVRLNAACDPSELVLPDPEQAWAPADVPRLGHPDPVDLVSSIGS